MASITDLLRQQFSSGDLAQVSQMIGADEDTTRNGVGAAIPLLMDALARNASTPEGAQALNQALEKDHDGSVLDNVQGYLQNPDMQDGQGILNHVLGDQQNTVTSQLSQATGLKSNSMSQLLMMAAPLVLGALAKYKQQQGLDADGLAKSLDDERKADTAANPDLMGMLSGMLDSNKDGSFLDDLSGIAGRLLGGQQRPGAG
jgi:hypothetical protein